MQHFGIFTTDANLVVRTWDQWLEKITSLSAGEVCGKHLSEIFPDLETRGVTRSFHRVLEDGAVQLLSTAFHRFLIDCPPQTPSRHFQRMQQRAVIAPLREESKITGLVVTIEDVTAR